MAASPKPVPRNPLDVYETKAARVQHQVTWEEPPPSARGAQTSEIDALLDEVAKRPSCWAKVCVLPSQKRAASHATSIKHRAKKLGRKVEVVARGPAVYVRVLK